MRSSWLWSYFLASESFSPAELFVITDLLHEERTARVPVNSIGPTVSGWLADLGVSSPLVDDLTQAVRNGDWSAACVLGEHLAVHVAIAA